MITPARKRSRVATVHAARRLAIATMALKRVVLTANPPTTNVGRIATPMPLVGTTRYQAM